MQINGLRIPAISVSFVLSLAACPANPINVGTVGEDAGVLPEANHGSRRRRRLWWCDELWRCDGLWWRRLWRRFRHGGPGRRRCIRRAIPVRVSRPVLRRWLYSFAGRWLQLLCLPRVHWFRLYRHDMWHWRYSRHWRQSQHWRHSRHWWWRRLDNHPGTLRYLRS